VVQARNLEPETAFELWLLQCAILGIEPVIPRNNELPRLLKPQRADRSVSQVVNATPSWITAAIHENSLRVLPRLSASAALPSPAFVSRGKSGNATAAR
jgi:hypothetical protein